MTDEWAGYGWAKIGGKWYLAERRLDPFVGGFFGYAHGDGRRTLAVWRDMEDEIEVYQWDASGVWGATFANEIITVDEWRRINKPEVNE